MERNVKKNPTQNTNTPNKHQKLHTIHQEEADLC